MLVSYFWSCLHPNSSSLSSLCYRFSSFSSKHCIVWGKLQNRRASRVWVKWRNFCSSFSGAEYIVYAFSLSTWCFDMKLLKVLRSESMERPGLKISKTLTFSELCITTRWLQHGKDQSLEVHKWKSQILCMPRKKLHRTRHIARSSSLFNTIAAFYTQCKGEPLTGHWCVMAALQMETFYTS